MHLPAAARCALILLRLTSCFLIFSSMTSSLLTHWATSLPATIQASSFLGSPAACCLRRRLDAKTCAKCPLHAGATFAPPDGRPLSGVVVLIGPDVELDSVPVGRRRLTDSFACLRRRSLFDSTPVAALVDVPHVAICTPDGVPFVKASEGRGGRPKTSTTKAIYE